MDTFRRQLLAIVDEMLAQGTNPAFLVVDLEGAAGIRDVHGAESLAKFQEATVTAVVAASNGSDTFTYGDDRVICILGADFDRLKTFALSQKLRRVIPLLGQSFDCYLRPEFDVIEYNAEAGIGALIAQLVARPKTHEQAA